MHVGEDYAWSGMGLTRRVRLLPTDEELRARERAMVRICDGAREDAIREVSIHELVFHWETGKQVARPLPTPRPKPPGVRRSQAAVALPELGLTRRV